MFVSGLMWFLKHVGVFIVFLLFALIIMFWWMDTKGQEVDSGKVVQKIVQNDTITSVVDDSVDLLGFPDGDVRWIYWKDEYYKLDAKEFDKNFERCLRKSRIKPDIPPYIHDWKRIKQPKD